MTLPFADADPPLRLLAAFHQYFPARSPEWVVKAPEREMWIAACTAERKEVTLVAPDQNARAVFTWRTAKSKRTSTNRPLPKWARYPAGIVLALNDLGIDLPGIEAVIAGEEPLGPRYDHALGMAFAALSHQVRARPYETDTLIEIVDRVRRDYVET